MLFFIKKTKLLKNGQAPICLCITVNGLRAELKPIVDNRTMQFASPEKALLDLLYLYPFYDNEQELEELRLDEDYLYDDLTKDLLRDYCARFQSKALDHRIKLLLRIYNL